MNFNNINKNNIANNSSVNLDQHTDKEKNINEMAKNALKRPSDQQNSNPSKKTKPNKSNTYENENNNIAPKSPVNLNQHTDKEKNINDMAKNALTGSSDQQNSNPSKKTKSNISTDNYTQNNIPVNQRTEQTLDRNIDSKNAAGFTGLMSAVMSQQLVWVKHCLKWRADVNIKTPTGHTIIWLSIQTNNEDITKLLIDAGADLNIKNTQGWTPLFLAILMKNDTMVKLLIDAGADLNMITTLSSPNINGINGIYTPLLLAIEEGTPAAVNLLIQKGANPNLPKDNVPLTPLLLAIKYNNDKVVGLLINNNADPDQINCNGQPPFTRAIQKGNQNIINLIGNRLMQRSDLKSLNPVTKSTLLSEAIKNKNEALVQRLIKTAAIAKNVPDDITTYLMLAIDKENKKIFKLLLEYFGANHTASNGTTLLNYALEKGKNNMAKLLIESGADLKDTNNDSNPISSLIQSNNLKFLNFLTKQELIKSLIDLPNLNQLNHDTKSTLLLYAILNNNKKCIQRLIETTDISKNLPDDIATYLMPAIDKENEEILKLLLECFGANHTDSNGTSLINYALKKGKNSKIVTLLIKNGANPDEKTKRGLLLNAINTNDKQMIEALLLLQDFDLNGLFSKDSKGFVYPKKGDNHFLRYNQLCPLIYAIIGDNIEMVKFLIEKGADPSQCTSLIGVEAVDDDSKAPKNGVFYNINTPLLFAIDHGNIDIAKFLIDSGADLNQGNSYDMPPLARAIYKGQQDIVQHLIKQDDIRFPTDFIKAICCHQTLEQINKIIRDDNTCLNKSDQYGFTPLIWAIACENIPVIEPMLKNGAQLHPTFDTTTVTFKMTPKDESTKNFFQGIIKRDGILSDYPTVELPFMTPIIYAINFENKTIIKLLIKNDAKLDYLFDGKDTPLTRAIKDKRSLQVIELLMTKDSVCKANSDKKTPVALAHEQNNQQLIDLLGKKGVKLDPMDMIVYEYEDSSDESDGNSSDKSCADGILITEYKLK